MKKFFLIAAIGAMLPFASSAQENTSVQEPQNITTISPNGKIKVTSSNNELAQALVFVNGEKVASLDDIDSKDIKSMEILKGSDVIEKYGEEAANGVVLITTKEGKKK